MLTLVFAVVLHTVGPVAASLRKVDAKFGRLYPYPLSQPGNELAEVMDAYQGIVDRRGPVPEAEAGIGRCLLLFGRYSSAVNAFRRAGKKYAGRAEEASIYAAVAKEIDRQSSPLAVRQLKHIPETDRWVAVLSSRNIERGWLQDDVRSQIVMYSKAPGVKIRQVGKKQTLEQLWAGEFCTLYLTKLSQRDRQWHLALFRESRGDCVPVDVAIYSVPVSGLKEIQTFSALEGAWMRGPAGNRGLLVSVAPTWKLFWDDLYEWTGDRFIFANRRHPRFYEHSESAMREPVRYADWMTEAAELDIHGRFKEAKIAWRKALRSCRRSIREEDAGHTDSHDGLYGSAQENMKEIIQRLRWIERADYNHALLYRPYDWDLQVPPYKLGKANEQDR